MEDVVQLTWVTGVEINSSHFLVQRSVDGVNYETIGSVSAAGNSTTPLTYTFYDYNPISGNNYYRLHQFDLDGKNEVNQPILVNTVSNGNAQITVFPNPTQGTAFLKINAFGEDEIAVEVIDSRGRVVSTFTDKIVKGQNTLPLNINGLSAGMYNVRVVYQSSGVSITKFIKQ